MTSEVTQSFMQRYARLPNQVQRAARNAYHRFKENPWRNSLEFKPVLSRRRENIWSARVDNNYRVLGYRVGNHMTWTWIGPHNEYDRMIA